MKWYAAHIIMYTKFKDGNQNKYPIWENVFLLKASSDEEAQKKAEKIGKDEESFSDEAYTFEQRPAELVFAGIRKIIECTEPEKKPGDGTEITYSQFEVDDEMSLKKLIGGEEVNIKYEE